MFTESQISLINELFDYGIEMESIEYENLPSYCIKNFPSDDEVYLVPIIDGSNYIFKVIIFSSKIESNRICNSKNVKIISTKVKNIIELLYVYYHNFNSIKKSNANASFSNQWKKILEHNNYSEHFEDPLKSSRFVLKYLLNTSKTEETSYFSK